MECENSSHVTIEIGKLEQHLNEKYHWGHGDSFDNKNNFSSICKVKKHIRENVYDPDAISIGPYHHKNDALKGTEQMKWNLIDYILKSNKRVGLQDYIKSLKKVENIARSYYTEEIKMNSSKFVNMLLLDGVFVLVCLRAIELTRDPGDLAPKDDDCILMEQLQFNFSRRDLLLIENQVPFFVLKIIYELFMSEETSASSFPERISQGVEDILYHYPKAITKINRPIIAHHLLHLCHIYLRPSRDDDFCLAQQYRHGKTVNNWHRAGEYHIAGVTIQKRKFHHDNPHSLLDVKFNGNMLEIPKLTIDENTPSLFKNLVALEQTNPKFRNDITAYLGFMSQLIKNAKDVSLLVSKGIIDHDLRCEEEVVNLFAWLSDGIIFDFNGDFYLKNSCHDLEVYYRSRTKSWNVWFRKITSAIRDRI